ncbi:MAG: hypothetical protein AB7U43_08565 [Desulfobacter sp.]
MTKKKYEELTDLEKLQKQWHKLSGLHTREEWSAAIIRAATAAEIAANFAVRREFEAKSEFDAKFVDNLLLWANGLAGKLDRLLLPLSNSSKEKNKTMKKLKTIAGNINSKRNAIAHQGEFCNAAEAEKAISKSNEFITTLVKLYDPEFILKERKR